MQLPIRLILCFMWTTACAVAAHAASQPTTLQHLDDLFYHKEFNRRQILSQDTQSKSVPGFTPVSPSRLRLDGTGVAGATITQLLQNVNNLAEGIPRIGSDASSTTSLQGDGRTAQRRASSATLRTLPLSTRASADGGASQVPLSTGSTAFSANSTSVAKDIVGDDNAVIVPTMQQAACIMSCWPPGHHIGNPKSFGAASIAEGITTVSNTSRQSASSTRGSAVTAAGEKALREQPRGIILDGSTGQASASQQGLGDEVSTRLRLATLSALSGESTRAGKAQSGGSYLAATASSRDGDISATRNLGKASNTAATLTTSSAINRYGYSNANDLADVRVESTEAGRAQVTGGRFGTGFNFGTATTTTSTYPSAAPGRE